MSASFERAYLISMADYNRWMNEKIYGAAAKLTMEQFAAPRGAYFDSLAGTLNHLVLADTIWLQRFAAHPIRYDTLDPVRALPAPTSLAQDQAPPIGLLLEQRNMLDAVISNWVGELRDEHLDQTLHYTRINGDSHAKRLGSVLVHFFNHQTHHRGQASTLLFQAGLDIGPTDLLLLTPEVAP